MILFHLLSYLFTAFAGVMELVDVLDSKSSGATRAGSTPAASIFPGRLAQLGEHLPYKQGVVGSSPASSIFYIQLQLAIVAFFILFLSQPHIVI